MLTFKEKYQAIVKKDISYEGMFITAVKTTGIFCRPVCNARKPKPENVVFYNNAEEAMLNGYRPCKICKPMEKENHTPQFIVDLIQALHRSPDVKITDWDLRQKDLKPHTVRRWFKKHHNMTFHAFQRMLRINRAYHKITNGESITDAAFSTGYDSLSGFNDGFRSIFGSSPSKDSKKAVINITRVTTPLGPMYACATLEGICLLEFTNRRMLETEFHDLQKRLDAVILPGENKHLDQIQKELAEYFNKTRKEFNLSLITPGTPFQKAAWDSLMQIPYGHTVSYSQQAKSIGRPKAIRAVGTANGKNRIAIIIPCHRVIGENGSLTGYGGGLARKKWLLDFEQN